MLRAAAVFAEHFHHWRLRLPERAVRERRRGEIRARGWRIRYLFGRDERGEYVDYYASHRMTDDVHVRIYESGECAALPAIISGYICNPAIPGDEERRRAGFFAANRRIAEELREKGFGDPAAPDGEPADV